MKKLIVSVIIAFTFTSVWGYCGQVQGELNNNLIRLHIIANSNSDIDQRIKLKIRDEILKTEGQKLISNSNLTCEKTVKDRLFEIEETANNILKENGFLYNAYAEYGRFDFPKKQYKNMVLPCGKYYGVRIVLGEGKGENWWCVLYPPLCMIDENEAVLGSEAQKILRENLSDEAYDVITENNGKIKVKFYLLEMAGKLKKIIGDV